MCNAHAKNTVRYYLIIVVLLAFLFFSNDFGLIDVQKTAIVTAVGIDREGEEFILTSQVAIPQSSTQGKATASVQLVSRGKTVADAFEEINGKTGWYPKLVFCKLIVLGEGAAQENVFDGLDFFLRDAYLTDDCQIAVCRGLAKDLLNTSPLVDPSSGTAISKVLSAHAERVGTVHPMTLKDFAIGYFNAGSSGQLPLVTTQPQQEQVEGGQSSPSDTAGGAGEESASPDEGNPSGGGQETPSGGKENKLVFSAKETALFVNGRWRDTLTAEETFALNAATGKLRLARYSVEVDGATCTLLIKNNRPKIGLNVGKDGRGEVRVEVTLVAGTRDFSKAQGVEQIKDIGAPPSGVFAAAEKKLASELVTAYEKARGVGCDLLELQERLVKYKKREYLLHQSTLLSKTTLSVKVRFTGVR